MFDRLRKYGFFHFHSHFIKVIQYMIPDKPLVIVLTIYPYKIGYVL